MSNIEKIKAEIERRIKAYKTKNGFPAGTICAIRIETYEGLLSFIDSMPEEHLRDSTKMISKDLDEAAENYIAPIENDEGLDYINFNGQEIKDAFKAGA